MNIAMLGAGAMGSRMAARLLTAGHHVAIYNRTPERAQPLAGRGAAVAATPRLAVRGAQLVLSMVRDDEASAEVWCGEEHGAWHALERGTVAIECSTLTQEWAQRWHARLAERGVQSLDAPVLGSRPQAEAGALIFLVGGEAGVLSSVREVLDQLGSAVLEVGPAGQGAAMKLLINTLFSIQVAAMSEVLQLARNAGFSETAFFELLEHIPVVSPASRHATNLMLNGRHDTMFPIDLVLKDLGYARSLDHSHGERVPLVGSTVARFERAQRQGLGRRNITAVDLLNRI